MILSHHVNSSMLLMLNGALNVPSQPDYSLFPFLLFEGYWESGNFFFDSGTLPTRQFGLYMATLNAILCAQSLMINHKKNQKKNATHLFFLNWYFIFVIYLSMWVLLIKSSIISHILLVNWQFLSGFILIPKWIEDNHIKHQHLLNNQCSTIAL